MKKYVAVILLLTHLWMGVAGFAEESKPRQLSETEKMDLYELGIMVGDETGELHLDKTITRAEAVKMICVAGSIQPQIPAGQTCTFLDVPENHWAYPYICAAQSQGIVCGDGAGNFYPEDKITNEEIIKILVCLLGYDIRAEQTGGYPGGYTREASRIGLTEGLQLDVYFPATRNDVGIMVYNSLDVPVMEQAENGDYVILDGQNGMKNKTLREEMTK